MDAQKAWDACKDRLEIMRQEIHLRWEESNDNDLEGRDRAYFMLKAIRQLEQSFKTDIDTAKLAKKQLELQNG